MDVLGLLKGEPYTGGPVPPGKWVRNGQLVPILSNEQTNLLAEQDMAEQEAYINDFDAWDLSRESQVELVMNDGDDDDIIKKPSKPVQKPTPLPAPAFTGRSSRRRRGAPVSEEEFEELQLDSDYDEEEQDSDLSEGEDDGNGGDDDDDDQGSAYEEEEEEEDSKSKAPLKRNNEKKDKITAKDEGKSALPTAADSAAEGDHDDDDNGDKKSSSSHKKRSSKKSSKKDKKDRKDRKDKKDKKDKKDRKDKKDKKRSSSSKRKHRDATDDDFHEEESDEEEVSSRKKSSSKRSSSKSARKAFKSKYGNDEPVDFDALTDEDEGAGEDYHKQRSKREKHLQVDDEDEYGSNTSLKSIRGSSKKSKSSSHYADSGSEDDDRDMTQDGISRQSDHQFQFVLQQCLDDKDYAPIYAQFNLRDESLDTHKWIHSFYEHFPTRQDCIAAAKQLIPGSSTFKKASTFKLPENHGPLNPVKENRELPPAHAQQLMGPDSRPTAIPQLESPQVSLQLIAFANFPVETDSKPTRLTPYSLFVPNICPSFRLSHEFEHQHLSNDDLYRYLSPHEQREVVRLFENTIQPLQLRRTGDLWAVVDKSWFPLWAIGQYVSFKSGPTEARFAKIVDIHYDANNFYDINIPTDLQKPTTEDKDQKKTSFIKKNINLYLLVTSEGSHFQRISLNQVSSQRVKPCDFYVYFSNIYRNRVRQNAINAWFCSTDGQSYLKDKDAWLSKEVAKLEKEHNKQDIKAELYNDMNDDDQNVAKMHDEEQPIEFTKDHVMVTIHEVTPNSQWFNSNSYDLSRLPIGYQKFNVKEVTIPLKDDLLLKTQHILTFYPTSADIAHYRLISAQFQAGGLLGDRFDDFESVVNEFKLRRGFVHKSRSTLKIEHLKLHLLQIHYGNIPQSIIQTHNLTSAEQIAQWAEAEKADIERQIKELTDEELAKQKQRTDLLAKTTFATAGQLNKRARHMNKQRFNTIIHKNENLSLVDLIYHETPQDIHQNIAQDQPEFGQLSTVTHSNYNAAGEIMKAFTDNQPYVTSSSATPAPGSLFKRQRVTLGSIASQLVQLPNLVDKIAKNHQFPLFDQQPFAKHLRSDISANYTWHHAEGTRK